MCHNTTHESVEEKEKEVNTNILKAIINMTNNPVSDVASQYLSNNRANSVGESLECYIKDLFCDSYSFSDEERLEAYNRCFSFLGNQNNPPDMIIRGGDAIEVKKITTSAAGIALNSSYPKDKIYANSSMITDHCRNAETWDVKDIIYIIGVVSDNKLRALWFIYGDCYAANQSVYTRIKEIVSAGIKTLSHIELANTTEIARVNRVDPLGITNLRVRGMWHIENPKKVFDYITIFWRGRIGPRVLSGRISYKLGK